MHYFPTLELEIVSLSHTFHPFACTRLNLRIGIHCLVPPAGVDFLHRIACDFNHPPVPYRKPYKRVRRDVMTHTDTFSSPLNNRFTEIVIFLPSPDDSFLLSQSTLQRLDLR